MRFFYALIFLLMLMSSVAWATPTHEGASANAQPVVAYGKDNTGAIKAIKVDTDGVLQTA